MCSTSIRIVRNALISPRRCLRKYCHTDLHDRNWAWNNYISARSLSQADNVRAQLLRVMERLEIDVITKSYKDQTRHHVNIRKALVCGYFMQVAHKEGEKGSYITVKDNQVRLRLKCAQRRCHFSNTYRILALIRWYRCTLHAVSTRNPSGSCSTNSCSHRGTTSAP
jgi:HrpA-like RNA helicase